MRPTWIEIDLAAIRHNVAAIKDEADPAEVCAVVKADGYGHGDVPVAEAALEAGASHLAVALVSEGARLREAGIEAPILLLSEPPEEYAPEVVRWGLIPTVYRRSYAAALAEAAPAGSPVHLKLDTGMHRVGAPQEAALDLAHFIAASPLALEGVWTHFAVAEDDAEYTALQGSRLATFLNLLEAERISPPIVHAANTAGALGHPGSRADMVRPGIGIYGLRPAPGFASDIDLRPAMRVVSHVAYVRRYPEGTRPSYGRRRPLPADATVATVPIGYADGVTRALGPAGGEVLIRGKRYPFAGTITMDQVVVDLGDDPVEVGDEVVLLGRQGDADISAEEWAERLGTITYEVVCGFGPRMPRRYSR